MNERKYPLPDAGAAAAAQILTEYLVNRRKELNLTLDELGERMGVKKATVSKIENRRWNVSLEIFIKWCYALEVNPYLVSLGESPDWMEKAMTMLGRRPDNLPSN